MIKIIKEKYLTYILIWCSSIIITAIIFFVFSNKERNDINYYKQLSPEQQIIELKKSYKKFKNLSDSIFFELWLKKFWDYQYKLNGNPVYNQTDCTISIFDFLIDLGANLKRSNAGKLKELLVQKATKRKNIKEVKTGDILIFWKKGDYGHAACAIKMIGNRIYYCDINAKDKGIGYNWIEFYKLEAVYNISFAFWAGDILSNIEDIED